MTPDRKTAEECDHQWMPFYEGDRCARCGVTVGARFYSKNGGWYTGNVSNAARAEDHTSLPRRVAGRIAMIDDDADNWIGEATRIIAEAFPTPAPVGHALNLKTTPAMRERLRELSTKGDTDDYDRVVLLLLEDFAGCLIYIGILADVLGRKPAPVGVEEIVAVLEKFARPGLFSEMTYDGETTFIEIFGGEWRAARVLLARLKDAPDDAGEPVKRDVGFDPKTQASDLVNYGVAITNDGERIAPEDFYKPTAPPAIGAGDELIERLNARALSYDEGGPSSIHTSQLLREAAAALASLTERVDDYRKGWAAAEVERDAALAELAASENRANTAEAEVAVWLDRNGENLRAALAEVTRLRDALEEAEGELVNLLPHIPQACIPGHAGFIDAHVEAAMTAIRAVLAPTQEKP